MEKPALIRTHIRRGLTVYIWVYVAIITMTTPGMLLTAFLAASALTVGFAYWMLRRTKFTLIDEQLFPRLTAALYTFGALCWWSIGLTLFLHI